MFNALKTTCLFCVAVTTCWWHAGAIVAQSVCLPAPRLLTTMPMGGKAGTEMDISITGEYLEGASEMYFSHPGITARPKVDENQNPLPNQYVVKIAAECPPGVYETRVMTRLGISSSRIFSVSNLNEIAREKPNTTLETATELQINSICNASTTSKAVDYYTFNAKQGQRVMVECGAGGIDSKLKAVLIIADQQGRDLVVERRGGILDFTAPAAGKYAIKVHDLTFNGGPHYFYRLAVQDASSESLPARLPSTQAVSSFSWPPAGLSEVAANSEAEPNNQQPQQVTLPCDIAGSFYPAADVDLFQFDAKAGDVWWVEVASERLGLPTDPSIVVQKLTVPDAGKPDETELIDLVELSDIPSPVKVSSNGYAYDGPPYNAGSTDILGKIEIKEDGSYQLRLSDLFGGTRSDPNCKYRMIIRKAQPDFAIVAWGLHMQLRNGDRNALSKPIALRGGATIALEVVAVRRDGFDGPIELKMENLPEGVTATGLTIGAGKSRGIMLVTAHETSPQSIANASFTGHAEIDGKQVTRACRLASMKWPVKDAKQEIPSPRLLADVPVSVTDAELAPLTIAPADQKVFEASEGEKLTIPLAHVRRIDFSGANLSLKTFGDGFESNPAFDVKLTADASDAVVDLAKLKTTPGDYQIAFYGGAVAKYSYNPGAVLIAEESLKKAQADSAVIQAEVKRLTEVARTVTAEVKAEADKAVADAIEKQKQIAAQVTAATKQVAAAKRESASKDIVDIIVTEPVSIRVNAVEAKK